MEALLKAVNIQKSFSGVSALKNGCITLQPGSVNALCGGNGAGKSTFLGILMGLLQRDQGEIRVKDIPVDFHNPADALKHKISIITQELSPIHGMTVAENIYLGREPRILGGLVNYKALFANASALLEHLQFEIDPRYLMSRLTLAQVQLVEIAKALSHDSDILIMDEPTTAIGEQETERLFDAIRRVTSQGAGIIYVSHRLSEIFTIADRYTVFRDGSFVEEGDIKDIDRTYLVRQIIGRDLVKRDKVIRATQSQAALEVKQLTRKSEFEDISLQVNKGEILGIYGLVGSGRSEFLNCVFGLTKPDSGQTKLNSHVLPTGQPKKSIAQGLSLVTEDRKETGLVLSASVEANISYSILPQTQKFQFIKSKTVQQVVNSMVELMKIKSASTQINVETMSGGNQQKVVLARCMSTNPSCLLCDEPTRGIDEGAKQEIYRYLTTFTDDNGAVIVVSSEAQEILEVSDRIVVFKNGKIAGELNAQEANQEVLLHMAS